MQQLLQTSGEWKTVPGGANKTPMGRIYGAKRKISRRSSGNMRAVLGVTNQLCPNAMSPCLLSTKPSLSLD